MKIVLNLFTWLGQLTFIPLSYILLNCADKLLLTLHPQSILGKRTEHANWKDLFFRSLFVIVKMNCLPNLKDKRLLHTAGVNVKFCEEILFLPDSIEAQSLFSQKELFLPLKKDIFRRIYPIGLKFSGFAVLCNLWVLSRELFYPFRFVEIMYWNVS